MLSNSAFLLEDTLPFFSETLPFFSEAHCLSLRWLQTGVREFPSADGVRWRDTFCLNGATAAELSKAVLEHNKAACLSFSDPPSPRHMCGGGRRLSLTVCLSGGGSAVLLQLRYTVTGEHMIHCLSLAFHFLSSLRHCLSLAFPLPFFSKTLPFACVFTAVLREGCAFLREDTAFRVVLSLPSRR